MIIVWYRALNHREHDGGADGGRRRLHTKPRHRLLAVQLAQLEHTRIAHAHGGGGRGRKSAATKAAEQAKLAAWLAAKYGDQSRVARQAASGTSNGAAAASNSAAATSSSVAAEAGDDDDFEVLGTRTADERNTEGAKGAVDLDGDTV